MIHSNNLVILRGRLGADPEAKTLPSGDRVANFSLATNHAWSTKDGQKQERTEWHSVDAWGQPGDFAANYLKKGDLVQVVGSLRYSHKERDPKDGKDGKDMKFPRIKVHELIALERRRNEERGAGAGAEAPAPERDGVEVVEGDFPF